MKFNKKYLLIMGVLLFTGIIWFFNQRNSIQRANIETQKAQIKTLEVTISSSGKTKAKQQVDLHFQTGGRLSWVGVTEGASVSAYQALASLDAQEFRKNLDKALRDYSKERNDFEEDRKATYKDKVMTDTVKRILEKNQWDLEKAVLDVELENIALKWTTLVSPINGIITRIDAPIAGVNVTATDTFTVSDPSSLVFSADIDETDIGQIYVGQTTEINLDAFPDNTLRGKIKQIAFAAKTTSGGATVYPVEITFESEENLRIGLNGDVSIILKEVTDALTIPNEAVQGTDENYVIKKSNNKYEKVAVQIGAVSNVDSQILEGLTQTDEVVTEGFKFLPKELQI